MKTEWNGPDGLPILKKMMPGLSADFELETCFYTVAQLPRLHAAIGQAIEQERVLSLPWGCPTCAAVTESMAHTPAEQVLVAALEGMGCKIVDVPVAPSRHPNMLRKGVDYDVPEVEANPSVMPVAEKLGALAMLAMTLALGYAVLWAS